MTALTRRQQPSLAITRVAKLDPQSPEVMETYHDPSEPVPPEVMKVLDQFVSPKTKSPARLRLGGDLAAKDYGSGFGVFVSLEFDVDPDIQTIDAAVEEVGQLVRNYQAEQIVHSEALYRELAIRV
ncbi:MAG: hypothetical protein HOE14_07530 [Gemmatimonadales bacterium]|nr:hypothetical protein [Gemmatimonadales bacterium]